MPGCTRVLFKLTDNVQSKPIIKLLWTNSSSWMDKLQELTDELQFQGKSHAILCAWLFMYPNNFQNDLRIKE